MPTIILHDERLLGEVEPGLGRVIKVGGSTPLADAYTRIKAAATSSGTELVIACHGYTTHNYDGMSNIEARGGFGLQLCRENLRVANVHTVSTLAGCFSKVWLMACAIAGAQVHGSRPFCRDFAGYAETTVIGADRNQIYHPIHHDNAGMVSRSVLRFGKWEGTVYQFNPDGTFDEIADPGTPLP